MHVLVTGGGGFIGSHITEALLEQGHRVTVLDSLEPYYDIRIKRHNVELCREMGGKDFEFIEGSITDKPLVDDIFEENDFSYVYHQAAQAGVRTSVENPLKSNRTNLEGLLNVLLASVEHDVKRFIHASSSSVYGRNEYLPFDENHPTRPRSPYGVTKLAAEHYCNVFFDLHDLSTVNLRYFTVYGPRMRPNMAISNFTSQCLNGRSPVIYGDGEQTRTFTYVDDIIDANISLLESDNADGETMNIGSAGNISINNLADQIIDETDANVKKVYEGHKKGDARHTYADVSKAKELIGYTPSIDIQEGVSQFIDWYRKNRDWYEPLVINS